MREQPSDVAAHGEGFSTRAAIWLIAALFALFLAVLAFSVVQSRRDAQRNAEDQAFAASAVVATNTRWIFELSQQALRRIDDALGPDIDNRKSRTVLDIREAVDSLPGIVKAYVVAADGRTLYSTDPEIQPIDMRDQPYFSELVAGRQWVLSSLQINAVGAQNFVMSRRLDRANTFAGAAIISIDVNLLKDIWSSLEFDERSTVTLFREDGMLVARYPLIDRPLDASNSPLFAQYLKASAQGTYEAVSAADGVSRFVGYRRVEGTPMIAAAAVSTDTAYLQFWKNTRTMLLVALPAALALGGAALWIGQLLHRDALRQQALAKAMQTNYLLLRDVHHRVKNNLQSVQSLVRMQAIPPDVKMDLQRRIAAMTAVHEHIYRLDQYVEVDAQSLLPAIVRPLVDGFGHDIAVEFDIDSIEVERDSATPLALLVNELVTNALKYAFLGERTGKIAVSLKSNGPNRATLIVADDGIGMSEEPSSGMGSRLIAAMVKQMDGTSSYQSNPGTTFTADVAIRAAHYPAQEQAAAAE